MWDKLVGGLFGKVGESYIEYKKEKKRLQYEVKLEELKGKIAYEKAKSDRAAKSEGYDNQWEIESLKNSGYKDEWTLALVSVPMIMSFIPSAQIYVVRGFEALDGTPSWYRFLIMSIFLATYGIRWWRRKL